VNMQEKGDVFYLMNSEDVNLERVFLGPQTSHPFEKHIWNLHKVRPDSQHVCSSSSSISVGKSAKTAG